MITSFSRSWASTAAPGPFLRPTGTWPTACSWQLPSGQTSQSGTSRRCRRCPRLICDRWHLLSRLLEVVRFYFFCYTPKLRSYIWISNIRISECGPQMARLTVFLPPTPQLVSNPRKSVELHQTGTFDGRSIDWATALRACPDSYSGYFWVLKKVSVADNHFKNVGKLVH